MILTSNSPLFRRPAATQTVGFSLLDHRMTQAHRHDRLIRLRVRPSSRNIRYIPRSQLSGHGYFGDTAILARRRAFVQEAPLRIVARSVIPLPPPAKKRRNELPCLLILPSRCFPPLDSSLGIGQNNCPPWPIRIVPPVPASAPSPKPSRDLVPDASSTAPPRSLYHFFTTPVQFADHASQSVQLHNNFWRRWAAYGNNGNCSSRASACVHSLRFFCTP